MVREGCLLGGLVCDGESFLRFAIWVGRMGGWVRVWCDLGKEDERSSKRLVRGE